MKQLLVIGKIWPEPKSTGAGWRMMQLLGLFKSYGYTISFGSASAKTEFSEDLSKLDIKEVDLKLNDPSFDDFLKTLKPDAVLYDRFMTEEQFGWRVAEACPKALQILDTEDLHCLRLARQRAFEENRKFTTRDLLNDTAKREIASIFRCDLSLIISEAEITLLEKVFHIDEGLLFYLPFLLKPDSEDIISELPSFEDRTHFVMLGNWLHQPNFESVKYVKNEIWPIVRSEIKEAELHVYGAYTSEKIKQFHAPKDGFHIKGRANDANRILKQSIVLLSPILYGAGLKTKFINAMQNGTPSVTTTIGAEGICGPYPFAGEIVNTPKEIAKEAIKLYTKKNQWLTAQKNGFKILENRFQESDFKEVFQTKLNKLQNKLDTHRQDNFLGEILKHHTLQSTKYMSKWIEAKNKTQTSLKSGT